VFTTDWIESRSDINWWSVAVGDGAILALVVLKRVAPAVPATWSPS